MSNQTKTPLQEIIEKFERASAPNFCTWLGQNKQSLLAKEKQIIVDAVNATDHKCVSHANIAIRKFTKATGNLFELNGEEGLNYYNDNFPG